MPRAAHAQHRKHLLSLQKRIYQALKRESDRILGDTPDAIRKYGLQFERDFSARIQAHVTKSDLVRAVRQSQVTLVADFHPFAQAQRTALRLLRDAFRPGEPWFLGLEMVSSRHQSALDEFMAGRLSEPQFLERIEYHSEWGFPWKNYFPLFQWARETGVKLVALNRPRELPWGEARELADLHRRDQWAAGIITDLFLDLHPKTRIVVLYGELHLGRSHLPAQISSVSRHLFGQSLRTVVVHQNRDEIYWHLARLGKEVHAQAVQLRQNEYCVISSPPWAKLQSLVAWAENGSRPPQELDDEFDEEDEDATEAPVDYLSLMRVYGDAIAEFMGVAPVDYDGLSVRGISDADFLDRSRHSRTLLPAEASVAHWFVEENRPLYIAPLETAYMGAPSPNDAAELGAIHLLRKHRPSESFLRDPHRLILDFAFGFLGSLVLNPRRKCDLPGDHFQRLRALERGALEEFRGERVARELVMRAMESARGLPRHFLSARTTPATVIACQWVGRMLATLLHDLVVHGAVPVVDARRLFFFRDRSFESDSARLDELRRIASLARVRRSKREKL